MASINNNINAYRGFQIAAKAAKAFNIGRVAALGIAAAALVLSGVQLFRGSTVGDDI
ncbi:MAG: hypothetical protein LBR73_02015 [Oscillospiraceae bacterium]|jgi:hypothetical protein|nr:hypothetical protein [Oscillospiraceae bacterium]